MGPAMSSRSGRMAGGAQASATQATSRVCIQQEQVAPPAARTIIITLKPSVTLKEERQAAKKAARSTLKRSACGLTGKAVRRTERDRRYRTLDKADPARAPAARAPAASTAARPAAPLDARPAAFPTMRTAASLAARPAMPAPATTVNAPPAPTMAPAAKPVANRINQLLASLPRKEGQPSASGLPSWLDHLATIEGRTRPTATPAAPSQASDAVQHAPTAPVSPVCVPKLPLGMLLAQVEGKTTLAGAIPADVAAAVPADTTGRVTCARPCTSPRPADEPTTTAAAEGAVAGCGVGGGQQGVGCRALSDPGDSPRDIRQHEDKGGARREPPGLSRHAAAAVAVQSPRALVREVVEERLPSRLDSAFGGVDSVDSLDDSCGSCCSSISSVNSQGVSLLPAGLLSDVPAVPGLPAGIPRVPIACLDTANKALLGEGGYGAVYKVVATSEQLGEVEVAYKEIKVSTEDSVECFIQEAVIMHCLNHPNILRMLGVVVGPDGRGPPGFAPAEVVKGVALECMKGGSLQDVLDQRPLTYPEGINIGAQVAQALAYMDSMGVGHFDIKPANMLLDEDIKGDKGRGETVGVKLADFGLCKVKAPHEVYYECGSAAGTICFEAPEMTTSAANPNKVSQKSEVYSLGLTLWQMSTRSYPFPALSDAEIISGHSLGVLHPEPCGWAGAWQRLVDDCTRIDPDDRPTLKEVVARLEQMGRDEVERAEVAARLEKMGRRGRVTV